MLRFTKLPKRTRSRFSFAKSPQITRRAKRLIQECGLLYIDLRRIFCIESLGSRSRAYARIWGLPRLWQETLIVPPAYIIEVTHRFFKLSPSQQDRVLLHELAHIPKNFSGALVGHHGIEKRVHEIAGAIGKSKN